MDQHQHFMLRVFGEERAGTGPEEGLHLAVTRLGKTVRSGYWSGGGITVPDILYSREF